MGEGEDEVAVQLEYTPTWVVAAVCSVMVAISLVAERLLHRLGKYLKKNNQNSLFRALQKVKEELMLLGFISLLLTVFEEDIGRICIPKHLTERFLPCTKEDGKREKVTGHFQNFVYVGIFGSKRRLLDESTGKHHCKPGTVQALSVEALHQLHIFIFFLGIVHVVCCLLTMILGGLRIHQWKQWEDSIAKDNYDTHKVLRHKVTHVRQHTFIKEHFVGFGKDSGPCSWLRSFIKQFYLSVTKSDYVTLRLGFIMTHCRGNPKFNFYKYMISALEADFKKVVGINWFLWIFVVIFLLLNVDDWHAYFWIAFIPLLLLLAVGAKLEHVIIQLAHDVAEKHTAIEGELVVRPSDDHFWLHRPRMVLYLIQFILFQNAFEMACFFWILTIYGWNSCVMGQARFIIPRLVIGVIVQIVCSYSTLPLYAIVTQMGSRFKKVIFDEHIREGLVGWAQKIKKRKELEAANGRVGSTETGDKSSMGIQLQKMEDRESRMEEGITETNGSNPPET
ncbi:hypothetical protein H6P81_011906 [Aristolochia fimbriata]|uniref:MLO-like protein n=1 Tax=Aristolochia fimbriata TaxID=158543 RepID=A0AAV7EAF7_ARIFI|nr:hypothetical protein H6P81_011906 [Aristolochia fimbriata]